MVILRLFQLVFIFVELYCPFSFFSVADFRVLSSLLNFVLDLCFSLRLSPRFEVLFGCSQHREAVFCLFESLCGICSALQACSAAEGETMELLIYCIY